MGHPVQGEMQLHRGRTLQSRKWTVHLSARIAWTNVSFSSVNIIRRIVSLSLRQRNEIWVKRTVLF